MQLTILGISLIAFSIGILFIFFPGKLYKIGKDANKIIFNDTIFVRHSVFTGSSLLLIGAYLVFVYISN